MLEVQRFESRLAQTLNSNSFDPLMLASVSERYPMLLLLETELDQLQVRLCRESEMDDFRLLSLYAARLHLTTYYFFDADKAPGYGLRKGLVKAYNAALAYISHCKASQLRNRGFAKHLPPVYTMTIDHEDGLTNLSNESFKPKQTNNHSTKQNSPYKR